MKKKLVKVLSVSLSIIVAVTMSSAFAFARGISAEIDATQSSPPAHQGDVTVNLDDEGHKDTAVAVAGSNTATVNGDVTVKKESGQIPKYEHYYTVSVYGGTANISGDVNFQGEAYSEPAYDGGLVIGGYEGSTEAGTANIGGNIKSSGSGVLVATRGKTNVSVSGDITAKNGYGIMIMEADELNVSCAGTISGKDAIAVQKGVNYESSEPLVYPSKINVTAWGLKSTDSGKRPIENEMLGLSEDPAKEILANVNYIIKKSKASANVFDFMGSSLSTATINGVSYKTGKANTVHKITVTALNGKKIVSLKDVTGRAVIVKNSDGTFSLTIPDGGFVTLEAVMQKASGKNGNKKSANTIETFTIMPAATITTVDANGKVILVSTPATAEEFNKQILDAVSNAPKKGRIEIATDKFYEMDKTVAEALKDRADLSLEIRCDISLGAAEARLVKIIVPAGEGEALSRLADKDTGKISFKDLADKYEKKSIDSIF